MAFLTSTRTHTIGLVSDTHGWLHPYLHEAFRGVDLIVHAGDIGTQQVLDELETIAPVAAVKGNIDGGELRFLPLTFVKEIGGKRIASLHIAGSPKSPKKAALDLIRTEAPDVIVVGHSHIPVVGKVEEVLWINPGAAGKNGFHELRFAALLHITEDGEFEMDRIHLGYRWEKPASELEEE